MADIINRVNSGFFDSINDDRLYSAEDMNRPYKRIISNGVFATQQGTPSTDLQVLSASSGMKIIVKKGEGLFDNKWFENPNDINITVPANANILPRRDSVIVQVDKRQSGRVGNIVYRQGTPASNPLPPDIGTVANVIEYRVANIYVAPSATNINQDAITDLRGSDECPWITSLIKQVDTSTLYDQWYAAYQQYYNDETARFEAFLASLTSQLAVTTNVLKLESHYTSTTNGETVIPINIAGYDKRYDVLMVRINRLFASEGIDYTIAANGQSITLTKDIYAGNNVDFMVLKSVIVADNETVLEAVQGISTSVSNLNTSVNTLNTNVNNLKSDGGWINFTLEGGATAYDDNNKPAVRKFGNLVNLRGAIKGVTATGTTICTLPAAYKPAMDYYFTTSATATGTLKSTVVIQILASSGQVKIFSKSGTIASTDMISVATNFIVG